jgi:hypothetical protein
MQDERTGYVFQGPGEVPRHCLLSRYVLLSDHFSADLDHSSVYLQLIFFTDNLTVRHLYHQPHLQDIFCHRVLPISIEFIQVTVPWILPSTK